MLKYVCPHCFREFVSRVELDQPFCWRCGQGINEFLDIGTPTKDKVHLVAMKILFAN